MTEREEPELNGEVHPKNQLNELTGAAWMYFTKSVLRTSYPSILRHDLRRRQGGNKPPQLMQAIIEFFTKHDGLVLDPFAGAGGTMLGAHLAGRRSVGLEINPRSVDIYHQVCRAEGITPHPILCGDCEALLDAFADDSFDLVATDPPYSIRLRQTMSGAEANASYQRANRRSAYVEYSDDPADLSNLASFEAYYAALERIGAKLHRVLHQGRYLVLILRDAYQDGEYIPTAYHVAERYRRLGFTLKGIQVWYATGTRIRPYGYPFAYVPNIIHQNIVILRKEAAGA
jgi:DNA modification methylase